MDNSNVIEERLKHLLSIVMEFVKFAEAKNAALLAFDSALIIGLIQVWFGSENLPLWMGCYLTCALIFWSFSALIVLISFLPLKSFPELQSTGTPESNDNIVFFGHIAKYDATTYLMSLHETPPTSLARYDLDLAGQVIINSRVALRKYRCFTWALWLTINGLVTPFVGIPVWAVLTLIKKFRPNG